MSGRERKAAARVGAGQAPTPEGACPAASRAPSVPSRGYPFLLLVILGACLGALITTLTANPFANPDSLMFELMTRGLLAGRGLAYEEPLLPGVTLFAFRSPGFPVFAAPLLALGGVSLVLAVQGSLVGICAAIIGRIAAGLGGRVAGWIAFVLCMSWWPSWDLARQFLSETLYTTLTVIAVVSALAVRRHGIPAAVATGLLVAAAALTRTSGAAVGVAIGIWLFRTSPRTLPIYLLAAVLAWAPWPIRNAVHLNTFVPFTTNGELNFYSGNTDVPPAECFNMMASNLDLGELGFQKMFAERSRREVIGRPAKFGQMLLSKAVRYVFPTNREPATLLHLVALAVILAAFVLARDFSAGLGLPALVWAAQGLLNILFTVHVRYRAPSDWVVVLAAALGAAALAARLRNAKTARGQCRSGSHPNLAA